MIDPIAFYLFDKNGIAIHWYGLIIAFGLVIGVFFGIREAKRRGYRSDMILDFLLIAIPLCIVCARLYYVVFTWSEYSADPLRIFAVWKGGLAIYGAVIGGAIAAFIFNRWRKVPVGEILDISAPSLILGQAIGRWGNFVNQEAYGNLITDPSLKWFPYGVYIQNQGDWYQATFFYESMWNLLVFAALMIFRKKIKVRGGVFALYVVLYGFGRFFIESLRTDSLYATGDVRVSQWLSAVLFVFGIAYLIIMSRRKKEYPVYDGLYSLSWTDEQVEEYKKSKKSAVKKQANKAEEEAPVVEETKPDNEESTSEANKKPKSTKKKKDTEEDNGDES